MSNTLTIKEEQYYEELFRSIRRMKDFYTYEGSVIVDDNHPIQRYWCASTHAVSPKQAKSNLLYQYKLEHGLPIEPKIDLPGILAIG